MHDDKRNYYYRRSSNNQPRANNTPQNNNTNPGNRAPSGRSAAQNTAQPQNNGRAPLQPRRTLQQTPQRGNTPPRVQPTRTVGQNPHNTPPHNYSQQGTRTPAPARAPRMAQNTKPMRPTQNGAGAPARRSVPAPVPQNQPGALKRFCSWLEKSYKVDKKAVAEREAIRLNLVREKGSIDYVFFILAVLLLAFGTVMVYSASYAYSKTTYGDSYYIITRQLIFVAIGLAIMAIVSKIPPEFLRKVSVIAFIVCLCMLIIVPIPIPGFTMEHNGARRWINLGFTEIQPSEFMKLGLAMMLAWFFDRYYERITAPTNLWKRYKYGVFTPLFITGVVCALVLIEKHLSGTIIMALIGVVLICASGAPIFWMAPGLVAGGGLFALLVAVLPHAKRRIDIWQNPELDPQNAGYQTLQGLYAIGSGGLFGEGLGNSYQKHMYVSQPQNDFIFVIVCEELGFIGAVAVILLFALLVWRGLIIAMNAPDIYSQLLVMGIVAKIAIQSILNIAVVTNTIPNTGISLPFFSYGGSSLIVLMAEIGIVLSISRFSKQRK